MSTTPEQTNSNVQFVDRVRTAPWAMLHVAYPEVLRTVQVEVTIDDRDEQPEPIVVSESPAVNEAAVPRLAKVSGQVAVIPIRGTIGQHYSSDYWAGTYTERLAAQVATMMASPSVGAVVLDIDSPGGIVYGTPEVAAVIRGFRGVKPIYGLANGMAASAAYWIGSSADKLFMTPSSEVGSIGVWSAHEDISGMLEHFGVDITLISAGEFKVEGHPFAPLDDEAKAEMQRSVDRYYEMFLKDVALGRGEKVSVVKATYGKGRLLGAEDAKAAGMVDGIATLPELISGIMQPKRRSTRGAALSLAIGLEEAE
jgi:capsid assembly protease